MMLNKILIQWFWVDVTTKALCYDQFQDFGIFVYVSKSVEVDRIYNNNIDKLVSYVLFHRK